MSSCLPLFLIHIKPECTLRRVSMRFIGMHLFNHSVITWSSFWQGYHTKRNFTSPSEWQVTIGLLYGRANMGIQSDPSGDSQNLKNDTPQSMFVNMLNGYPCVSRVALSIFSVDSTIMCFKKQKCVEHSRCNSLEYFIF